MGRDIGGDDSARRTGRISQKFYRNTLVFRKPALAETGKFWYIECEDKSWRAAVGKTGKGWQPALFL